MEKCLDGKTKRVRAVRTTSHREARRAVRISCTSQLLYITIICDFRVLQTGLKFERGFDRNTKVHNTSLILE